MGYWCEISGVTGAIHRPLCPPPTPTNQIHYPVTTKNTFDEISNGVQYSKHCIEEKGSSVFIAQKMAFLYRGWMSWSMKEWGLFLVIISRVTSDSLHLSGLGGQTDGLSLISPESVVSTARRNTLKINSQGISNSNRKVSVGSKKFRPQYSTQPPTFAKGFFSLYIYCHIF